VTGPSAFVSPPRLLDHATVRAMDESTSSASYNAVPLPAMLASTSGAAASSSEGDVTSAPLISEAAQRLAALKAKLGAARQQNHKAVVAEDRRNRLGEEGLKAERIQRAYEKKQQAVQAEGGSGEQTEMEYQLDTTAEAAAERQAKAGKKAKRRAEYGWDVFNNEAQYRHYKKQTTRTAEAGRAATGEDVIDEGDPDPLAYGHAPPVAKERVQALVEDMHEAALRRSSWSRRRTFNEEADVTYINKRNEVFNKKIERSFDPYTAEIRANLERGTAL